MNLQWVYRLILLILPSLDVGVPFLNYTAESGSGLLIWTDQVKFGCIQDPGILFCDNIEFVKAQIPELVITWNCLQVSIYCFWIRDAGGEYTQMVGKVRLSEHFSAH